MQAETSARVVLNDHLMPQQSYRMQALIRHQARVLLLQRRTLATRRNARLLPADGTGAQHLGIALESTFQRPKGAIPTLVFTLNFLFKFFFLLLFALPNAKVANYFPSPTGDDFSRNKHGICGRKLHGRQSQITNGRTIQGS